MKKSIYQEDTVIVSMYAPKIGPPKYIEQIVRDL